MKIIAKISFVLLVVLLFTTCQKDHLLDCLRSTGQDVTEFRKKDYFDKINLKDNIDVVFHRDTLFRIEVMAGQNLIDGIITEQSGSTIYIRNENRCNWMRSFKNKYTVHIYSPTISKVDAYGAGDFICADTIVCPEFSFDSWNASGTANLLFHCDKIHLNNNIGRMTFNAIGFSAVSFYYINDTGVLDAHELQSDLVYIRSVTTGFCKVNVQKELGVEIRYTGNIYYYGNPYKIDQQITGAGQLVHS